MKEDCPKCGAELDLTGVESGHRFTCDSCKGQFMMVGEDGMTIQPPSERSCLACAVPVVVLAVAFVAGLVALWPRIQEGIEQGFAEVLRTEGMKQATYRGNRIRDEDGDGIGEFVFVADMPLMEEGADTESDAPIPGIPAELKVKVAEAGGVIELGAYSLIFYLPGWNGQWVADDGSSPPRPEPGTLSATDQARIDARERAFILYAVPNRPGWLGARALVIDQGGKVFACENTPGADGAYPYSRERLPAADAAYPTAGAALDAPLGSGDEDRPARDGRLWRRLP